MLCERIKNVMVAVFGVDSATIHEDTSPSSIEEWDSLRHMNLILALEDEFGVRFPEDQVDELISFRLIELSLRELMSQA